MSVFVDGLTRGSLVTVSKYLRPLPLLLAVLVVIGAAHPTFAADGNVGQVETFIRSIIKVMASLAGLVAAGFFVVGGFSYITSTGHPERLDRAKHTLIYSGVGLAVVIGAFVISNIVVSLATSAFGS